MEFAGLGPERCMATAGARTLRVAAAPLNFLHLPAASWCGLQPKGSVGTPVDCCRRLQALQAAAAATAAVGGSGRACHLRAAER